MMEKKGYLLLIVFVLGCFLVASSMTPAFSEGLKLEQKAPELKIKEWLKSKPLTMEKLKGKVVVIGFFQITPAC